MKTKPTLVVMIAFAFIGLGVEVLFTGVTDCSTDTMLMGYSSVWYVPFYFFIPWFFYFAYPWLIQRKVAWYLRGIVYAISGHIIEFFSMALLRGLLGHSPSEASYYQSGYSICGLTRLDYFVPFYLYGLFMEWLFIRLADDYSGQSQSLPGLGRLF